jgi:hypothetical protein
MKSVLRRNNPPLGFPIAEPANLIKCRADGLAAPFRSDGAPQSLTTCSGVSFCRACLLTVIVMQNVIAAIRGCPNAL